MTTYLVTGATGYIGSHLVRALCAQPDAQVVGLSLNAPGQASGWRSVTLDLLSDKLRETLQEIRPEVIFHLAGAQRFEPRERQEQVSLEGTRRLLTACWEAGLRPLVVVAGSAAEYGLQAAPVTEETPLNPMADYGRVKAAQTQLALELGEKYNVPVIAGRIFNVYGQSDTGMVIGAMTSKLVALAEDPGVPQVITVQNLQSSRDFIHIEDVVRAFIRISEAGQAGEIYNIASGEATRIEAVLDRLLKLTHCPHVQVEAQGPQEPDLSQAVIKKIQGHTGWQPSISLDEGLRMEVAYWQSKSRIKV